MQQLWEPEQINPNFKDFDGEIIDDEEWDEEE
jgi:hypothetical protein